MANHSLIKKGLKDDNLITRFDEAHESAEHTLIGTGGDGDLGLGIQLTTPEGRVGIRNGLPQPRPSLGRGILVALDTVQGFLGSIEDELGRVVTKESLAQVHNWLVGRGGSGLVDDGPVSQQSQSRIISSFPSAGTHQTSFLWPSTRAAGWSFRVWLMVTLLEKDLE